jgi:hypothetical protein
VTGEKAAVPRARRLRDFLLGTLLRPLVLAFWAFVFWGTLLAFVFLASVLSSGWAPAVASLWPDAEASAWAYLNLGCVGLALVVWTLAGVFYVLDRRASVEGPS